MSRELREAAERINESLNGGGASLAYPKHRTPADVSNALHAECSMIASAYLAEHPADDEEPGRVIALNAVDAAFQELVKSATAVLMDNLLQRPELVADAGAKFTKALILADHSRTLALAAITSYYKDKQ